MSIVTHKLIHDVDYIIINAQSIYRAHTTNVGYFGDP